jgi:hypothetical protein
MQARSSEMSTVSQCHALVAIKTLHTVVWALMVAFIAWIPVAAWEHRFHLVAILSGLVWIECGVLAINRGRCPLSDLAKRFTAETTANLDIYLPEWIARWNKGIFGTLFVINELIALTLWVRRN